MTPDLPLARRRRYRFTIRRALLALPAVALIIVLIIGINPLRPDPMPQAIAEATAWCRTPAASFRPVGWPHSSANSPAVDQPCVLKVVRVGDVVWDRRIVRAFGTDLALAPDGRLKQTRRSPSNDSDQQSALPRDAMTALGPILPTLPTSTEQVSFGPTIEVHLGSTDRPQQMTESRALVVGFHDGKAWVTRVYDRTRLPPEVARLLALLGIDPSLP